MADGGGTRPEFERGRGFWWPEAVVRAWGAVGRGVTLERGAGEEWVMEERTVFRTRFERPVGGATERKKGRERGGPAAGVPRSTGRHRGAWPRPAGGARQRPERGARGRRVPRARCRSEIERGD
jgi:hypothetical protein